MWRAALLVAVVGCVHSASHVCADGRTCPSDQVCDDQHALCVFPDQLTSCGGDGSNNLCSISEVSSGGECVDGVCIAQACGDHLVTGDETCDGADTQPEIGTCVDLEFDYGALTCSQICGDDPKECGELGWQFIAFSGVGGVQGFAEDNGVVWAAAQQGISRRDHGVWTSLGFVTASHVWAQSVWAGGGHVFVVGFVTGAAPGYVLHYDGTSWTEQAVSPGHLLAVWGRSATEVYAVGEAGFYKYDGATWTAIPFPVGDPVGYRSVSGSDQLVVAGTVDGHTVELTPAGTKYAAVVANEPLNAVYVSGTNVLVAGGDGFVAVGVNQLYTPLDNLPATVHALSARSPTEIYAALDVNARSNIFRFDGKSWAAMISPLGGQPLNTIFAGATATLAARNTSTVMEYQGAGWIDESPGLQGTSSFGIWATEDGYAVSAGGSCIIYERGGRTQSWSLATVSGSGSCCLSAFGNDAWGTDAQNVYIGGSNGMMLHKSAGEWMCQPLPNGNWVFGLWGSSATDIWAVGSDGASSTPNLMHSDGTAWSDRSSDVPFATALRGVWGSSSHDVFAVGLGGVIAHFDGSAWSAMTSGTTEDLHATWGAGPGDVFAVGTNGTLLHYDGTGWTRMPLPIGRTLALDVSYNDVHGTSGHDVYAVGQRVVLHYDGTHWAPIRRPDQIGLTTVFATTKRVFIGTDLGVGSELLGFTR